MEPKDFNPRFHKLGLSAQSKVFDEAEDWVMGRGRSVLGRIANFERGPQIAFSSSIVAVCNFIADRPRLLRLVTECAGKGPVHGIS